MIWTGGRSRRSMRVSKSGGTTSATLISPARSSDSISCVLETPEPRRAQQALRDLPGVIALAQIGTSLRVLAANEPDLETRVEARLASAGIAAEVAPTAPNLEDVFVAATRKPVERAS